MPGEAFSQGMESDGTFSSSRKCPSSKRVPGAVFGEIFEGLVSVILSYNVIHHSWNNLQGPVSKILIPK